MGDVHHVAARDGEPFGRHFPAQAAAVVALARGLEVAHDRRLGAVGDAGQRDRGGGCRRRARTRRQAAQRVELPVEVGLDIAHGDLVGRLAAGVFHGERAGDDVARRYQGGGRAALVLPDDAEPAGLPGRARAAALRDHGEHVGMGERAVEHGIAGEAAILAPGAPGLDRGLVDARVGQAHAGHQAAGDAQPARIPAEQPGGIRARHRLRPARAVPRRHALLHDGRQAIEAARELAGGADAKAEPGLAGIVGRVRMVSAERHPREIVIDAIGGVGVGGAAHAHAPGAGGAEIVGKRAAQRGLAVVAERDAAPLARAAGGRPPFDLDGGAVGPDLAVVGDAEQAADEIDADALRAGCRRALDEGGILEGAAGAAVDVAGHERDAPLGVAELGLDLGVGGERRVADLEIGDGEIAEAEVEYLVEVLIAVHDLGILGGAEVGKDAVPAEHEQQRLIRSGPVGAAGEAVDRLGRGAGAGGIGRRQGKEGVEDEPAGDGDGRTRQRLRPCGGEKQGRHDDGGHQEGNLEDRAQRVLVVVAGEHGAERDDLAAGERRLRPGRARHGAAVHGGGHGSVRAQAASRREARGRRVRR